MSIVCVLANEGMTALRRRLFLLLHEMRRQLCVSLRDDDDHDDDEEEDDDEMTMSLCELRCPGMVPPLLT